MPEYSPVSSAAAALCDAEGGSCARCTEIKGIFAGFVKRFGRQADNTSSDEAGGRQQKNAGPIHSEAVWSVTAKTCPAAAGEPVQSGAGRSRTFFLKILQQKIL